MQRHDQTSQSPDGRRWVSPALFLAVLAISFAAIFFRKAAPTHPLAAAAIRLGLAAAMLSPFLGRAIWRRRLPMRVVGWAVAAGLLYGVHFGAWIASLQMTTVAASVTLVTATPLMLGVVGVLTGRDRPSSRLWLAISVALCGLMIIGGYDVFAASATALMGDALALVGAAAMAGYLLIVRRLGEQLDVLAFGAVATFFGAVTCAAAAGYAGVALAPASQQALFYLFLAALIPQLIGHNLLTWAVGHASPTKVGLATVGEPVGATLLGWLWLGEVVSGVTLLGCAVTLASVMLAVRARPRG